MRISRLSGLLLVSGTLLSGAARADVITVYDHVASGVLQTNGSPSSYSPHNVGTSSGAYTQNIAGYGTVNFGDIIGQNGFDILKTTITRNANNVVFDIYSKFTNGLDGAYYSDIFIDTVNPAQPGSFNYGIHLGGGFNRTGALAAGLYQLNSSSDYKTSLQVWSGQGGSIGGLIQPCEGANNVCTGPETDLNGVDYTNTAIRPPTLVTGGTLIGTVSTSFIANAIPGYNDLRVIVTPSNMSLFNGYFDFLATSADCANDAMWGEVPAAQVPAPGGLALLGLGLAGLAALRRRKAA